jgi:Secretion system C-terminal sorting domain
MMNKVKCILILSLYCLCGWSQSAIYHPFPDSSFSWIEEYTKSPNGYCCCSSAICINHFSYDHFLEGDTVVNNQTYFKLYETGSIEKINVGPTVCSPGDFSPCYYYFFHETCAWLRQDTALRQVYVVMPGDTMEILLYDFNMQLGDTVQGLIGAYSNYVSSIDSTLVGNAYHKRFWLTAFGGSQLGYDSAYAAITEGLGSSKGMMIAISPDTTNFGVLLCAYDNGLPVWPSNQSGCIIPTGLHDKPEMAIFSIYPNPAQNQVFVKTNGEPVTITILNSVGQVFCQRKSTSNETEIDLSGYCSGLYFVQVDSETGFNSCLKLVVE